MPSEMSEKRAREIVYQNSEGSPCLDAAALIAARVATALDDAERQGREAGKAENVNLKALLKDICDEWNEGCDPACDSYGHEKTCKSVNIANAKRALQSQLEGAQAEIALLRESLAHNQSLVNGVSGVLDSLSVPTNGVEGVGKRETLTVVHRVVRLRSQVQALQTELSLSQKHTRICDSLMSQVQALEAERDALRGGLAAMWKRIECICGDCARCQAKVESDAALDGTRKAQLLAKGDRK